MLPLLIGLAFLSASAADLDGGGASMAAVSLPVAHPVVMPLAAMSGTQPAAVGNADPVAPGAITSIVLDNPGPLLSASSPISFGQIFAEGHWQPGEALSARLSDGTRLPLQADIKALHPDGSVRHAVLTVLAPPMAAGQARSIALVKGAGSAPHSGAPVTPLQLLEHGFSADVQLTLGQHVYTASLASALRSGQHTSWLAGPLANEWLLSVPLVDPKGQVHPHLAARFAVRALGSTQARVDVTLENTWAFEPEPQNFTYDSEITIGHNKVYSKSGLTHFHHARWRKVFWWGAQPQLQVRHNTAYLIASRALPNYDQTVHVSAAALAALKAQWTGARTEPMGAGLAAPYMPTTGGRAEIGLLPGWAASYLLSMDARAKEVTLGSADQAGSWSAHFRDRHTGRPVSVLDYPYMTVLAHRPDTLNPATGKLEAFPACATSEACATPYHEDAAHQPGFAYLPYLVTGDYYYLEELQFWAMWNAFSSNPAYREHAKGLFKSDQVRGQAWSLRTLGEAAYITPDADPLKQQFATLLNANLDWYNTNYTHNPEATPLGALTHGYAIAYQNGTGLAPWMDDFFTSAIGHLNELGFAKAKPLLAWKVKFPIARMSAPGTCWIQAAIYALKVRDSATAPLYTTMGQAWHASQTPAIAALACDGPDMAHALGLHASEMTGYAHSETGFPANMQPALAYAADAGGAAGAKAWALFAQRSIKPDYGLGPQFAIVPRP
ncbi:MAG: hypothetical protein ACJ8GW_00070 [Massilia sp.]